MNTITRILVPILCGLALSVSTAQNKQIDTLKASTVEQIKLLEEQKIVIENEEKALLKEEVEAINKRLDRGEISVERAKVLKKEAAEKRALNIENRWTIIDNKIALLKRNKDNAKDSEDDTFIFRIGGGGQEDTSDSFIYLGSKSKDKPRKYDIRTFGDIVFAIGFNNAIIEGQSINDSPYKIGGSGFVELGYAWKTRLFENTNFWRLKYGFSFQWNKLNIKNNQYLVDNAGDISLEEFPLDLDKAKFRMTNLVFPAHIEFGPSKKIERENYIRYSTYKQLKIGLGGYAGVNLGHMQKLKYEENGDNQKDKQRGDFDVNEFVYGLSGYIALGEVALYVKYDLNPIFKNQDIDQNNISVGLRFDMD